MTIHKDLDKRKEMGLVQEHLHRGNSVEKLRCTTLKIASQGTTTLCGFRALTLQRYQLDTTLTT